MPIYRITFQTELLVDCETEGEAERIGFKHLEDEVRNGTSEVYLVEKLDSVDQLRRAERGSLPWRRYERNSMGESFYMVDEILERNVASG